MRKRVWFIFVPLICLCMALVAVYAVAVTKEPVETFQLPDEDRSSQKPSEQFAGHLSRVIEEGFLGNEAVFTANADVGYDDATDTYSVILSLTTKTELSDEQVELYKTALSKMADEYVLIINGTIH